MTVDRAAMAAGASTPNVEGPPVFKFTQPGDEVFGQVTRASFGFETQFGIGNVIEVADEQRGEITVWLSNAQLDAGLVQGRNQLGRRVQEGDVVYIRFDGKTNIQGGKTLSQFAINVQAGQPSAVPQHHAPAQAPPPQQNGYQQPQQPPAPPQQAPQQQWPQQAAAAMQQPMQSPF